MLIGYYLDEDQLEIGVDERLDVNTPPELKKVLNNLIDEEIKTVVFNFENLEFLSSGGLSALKFALEKPGKSRRRKVIIERPKKSIYDLLCASGFNKIMDIREIIDEET